MDRYINKFILIQILSLVCASPSYAQKKLQISGKVVTEEGVPLPGAVVSVQGTGHGTMVADDGSYTLDVSRGEWLEASMMGYSSEIRQVESVRIIDFTLKEDADVLEAAVVEIGYGEQRIVDLTGAVSRVEIDDVSGIAVSSLDQALQGKVAGLRLSYSDGQPGTDMDVVIRGANSMTQSNSPLYVIDGFPLEEFSASAVHPKDIASISVLKDASATAIYGSRGANGVIIIETKRGKLGAPKVAYSGTVGFQKVSRTMEMMDAYDFVKYQLELDESLTAKYLTDMERTLDDYMAVPTIDWQDKIFRTAIIHSHNLSLTGGTRVLRYSASLSATDLDGVIYNSGYGKYQGRFSFESDISKKLRFSGNISYTHTHTSGQASSNSLSTLRSYQTYLMYRVWAYRPVLLSSDSEDALFDDEESTGTMNPVVSNSNEYVHKKTSNFMGAGKLTWEILPSLKFTTRAGYTRNERRNEEFYNSLTYKGYYNASSNMTKGPNGLFKLTTKDDWMSESTLTYKPELNRDHRLNVMVGYTMQGQKSSVYGYSVMHVPDESLGMSGLDDGVGDQFNALLSDNSLMSGLVRMTYGLKNRYNFTASVRADGSSKFTAGNKWGVFPSAAFAWRLGQEPFMKSLSWLSDAKIRLSYGITGNNRVGDYDSYSSIELSDYYSYGGETPTEAYTPVQMSNSDLKWEKTSQYDIGVDLFLFANRMKFTVDLYHKVTDDLLLKAKLPYSTGYASTMKNVGKISNSGLELSLNTVNIRRRNFEWTTDVNISFNRSRVLELADGQESYLSTVSFTGDFNSSYLYLAKVGGPVAAFYGYVWDGNYQYSDFDYVDGTFVLKNDVPTNGNPRETIQPGDIRYVDQNGDGVVNSYDMTVIGNCEPIHTGGFGNDFRFYGFHLNLFFTWSYGNQIMNANRIVFEGNYTTMYINQYKSYTDRWSDANQESRNYRVGGQGPRGMYSTRTLEDGSYLRLNNVQLGYSLPEKFLKKVHISSCEIYLSGQNLWLLTGYSGLDPEVSTKKSALTPGFDYSSYARNRVFQLGLNIEF